MPEPSGWFAANGARRSRLTRRATAPFSAAPFGGFGRPNCSCAPNARFQGSGGSRTKATRG
eukprot:3644245-Lingulodinium_polyedra.AAC.1